MKTELAVIATAMLKDCVEQAMRGLENEIEYSLYFYSNFTEVLDIYRSIPEHVRGVVVSGGHPEQIIQKAYPNDGRVVKAFINDTAAIFKQFLGLFREYPGLTTERIYVDVFELIGIDLDNYLFGEQILDWDDAVTEYFHGLSVEETIANEAELYEKHLRLWWENKVDVCLTRFSSLVGPLEAHGVNVRFMYPSESYIRAISREVASEVKIAALQDNQPAVMLVTSPDFASSQSQPTPSKVDALGKLLQNYIKKFDPEAILTRTAFGYEVVSNRKALEKATNNLSNCRMQRLLKRRLKCEVAVGYGLGSTLPQARLNAVDANREAMLRGGESFLVNDKDQMIGPLEQGHPMVVSRKTSPVVQEIAAKTGLSSLTIQKVLSAAEDAEDGCITSQYLAQKLSITKRSANRFLSVLLANGQAEVIGMRRATTRGRPERLYRLRMEQNAVDKYES